MPQIRHNRAGSFLKKIKIKSEASVGRPAFSVGAGGGPEEPDAFFSLRGRGVAMETRAAGEPGWGLGGGGGGGGAQRGAREAVASSESGRSARAAGRRRDLRPRAESGRSGVLRRHVRSLAVSRRLGFLLRKKVTRMLAEKRAREGSARARARSRFQGNGWGWGARQRPSAGVPAGGMFESPRRRLFGRSASFLPALGFLLRELGSSFRPTFLRQGVLKGQGSTELLKETFFVS